MCKFSEARRIFLYTRPSLCLHIGFLTYFLTSAEPWKFLLIIDELEEVFYNFRRWPSLYIFRLRSTFKEVNYIPFATLCNGQWKWVSISVWTKLKVEAINEAYLRRHYYSQYNNQNMLENKTNFSQNTLIPRKKSNFCYIQWKTATTWESWTSL